MAKSFGQRAPSMSTQANQPLPDRTQLDEYCIERLLASGGFSFVYLARNAAGMACAIKEYLPATLPMRTARGASLEVAEAHRAVFSRGLQCFFAEAKALARLRHPHVVRVLKFFRANGTAYMAMRYERGRTLQHYIESEGQPPHESWIRAKFAMLLNGLREVHSNRLVHLDIKPANVYLREGDDPMLIDFGAARAALGGEAANLPPTYTPGFAAPEHHGGRGRLGPWSDIYSVGACMHACISGEAPPPASERLQDDRLQALQQRSRAKYSTELLRIVEACMSLDPEERPGSVLSLQKALLGEAPPREAQRRTGHANEQAWAI
jgi:serine/threonine protein kinase